MVPYLGGVIEYSTVGFHHNSFEGSFFELGSGDKVIQVIYVSLMMFSVVELQGFL
jgi:hypothetical protein